MNCTNPTKTKTWKLLSEHFEKSKSNQISSLFEEDPDRYEKFKLSLGDIVVDFSKNRITEETIRLLIELSKECGLHIAIEEMMVGKEINHTEKRAVLHTALRNRSAKSVFVDGKDIMPAINEVLLKMKDFAHRVHSGEWRGFSGKKIKSIVLAFISLKASMAFLQVLSTNIASIFCK